MVKPYTAVLLTAMLFTVLCFKTHVSYAHNSLSSASKNKPLKDVSKLPTDLSESTPNIPYLKKINVIRRAILHLNPSVNKFIATQISAAIYRYSVEYSIDPLFILSVISVETGNTFIPNINKGFGWGLMQIVPRWHKKRMKKLGANKKQDLYNIFTNINIGCDILSNCLQLSNGCKKTALVYYNGSHLKYKYSNTVLYRYNKLKKSHIFPTTQRPLKVH